MSGHEESGFDRYDLSDEEREYQEARKLDREDRIERLQDAGMEPIDSAPHDREITVVIEETLLKKRALWHDGLGCWMVNDSDGEPWPRQYSYELIGWLP